MYQIMDNLDTFEQAINSTTFTHFNSDSKFWCWPARKKKQIWFMLVLDKNALMRKQIVQRMLSLSIFELLLLEMSTNSFVCW